MWAMLFYFFWATQTSKADQVVERGFDEVSFRQIWTLR